MNEGKKEGKKAKLNRNQRRGKEQNTRHDPSSASAAIPASKPTKETSPYPLSCHMLFPVCPVYSPRQVCLCLKKKTSRQDHHPSGMIFAFPFLSHNGIRGERREIQQKEMIFMFSTMVGYGRGNRSGGRKKPAASPIKSWASRRRWSLSARESRSTRT